VFRFPRAPDFPAPRGSVDWAAAVACLALAGHVTRLPAWLLVFSATLIGWRVIAEHARLKPPGRLVRYALAALLFAGVISEFGRVIGRDAGVALLAGLSGLKFVELADKRRDFAVSVLLSWFVALGAVLYEQSLLVSLYAGFTLAAGLAALYRLADPGRPPPSVLLRRAGTMLALAAPLTVLLYLLFPRLEGSLWGLPVGESVARTGMTNQLDPGSVSALSHNDAVAFRVVFDARRPPMSARYWRGLVLEASDGRRWFEAPDAHPDAIAPHPRSDPYDYTVTMEPSGQRWLFALELPARADPAVAAPGAGQTLRALKPIDEVTRYHATSYIDYTEPEISMREWVRNLELPPISRRVATLASRLQVAGRGEPRRIAAAALDYFSNQPFRYTLRPPLLGPDPVDEFLFDTRAGYCEHYASAFTTLMRAAGVPARVVVGYMGGEFDPDRRYLVVRQSDAHAWAEIWTDDRGWTRVDPTAAVAPERIEYGAETVRLLVANGATLGSVGADELARIVQRDWVNATWRRLGWYADGLERGWNDWVAAYGPERQMELLRTLGMRASGARDLVVALAIGLALLLAILAVVGWARRERPAPVVVTWNRYCARLARAGLARAAHEGPLAYLERCQAARPDLRAQLQRITNLYVSIRYRDNPDTAVLRELRARVRAFRPAAPAS